MIAFTRRNSLLTIIVVVAALAAGAMTIGAQQAQAAVYRSCTLSEADQDPSGEKPAYNFTLKRKGATCATARKVMYAFHACRSAASFRCARKVLTSWSCTGTKSSSTATIFYAKFTCSSGSRRVQSSYQQNT